MCLHDLLKQATEGQGPASKQLNYMVIWTEMQQKVSTRKQIEVENDNPVNIYSFIYEIIYLANIFFSGSII